VFGAKDGSYLELEQKHEMPVQRLLPEQRRVFLYGTYKYCGPGLRNPTYTCSSSPDLGIHKLVVFPREKNVSLARNPLLPPRAEEALKTQQWTPPIIAAVLRDDEVA